MQYRIEARPVGAGHLHPRPNPCCIIILSHFLNKYVSLCLLEILKAYRPRMRHNVAPASDAIAAVEKLELGGQKFPCGFATTSGSMSSYFSSHGNSPAEMVVSLGCANEVLYLSPPPHEVQGNVVFFPGDAQDLRHRMWAAVHLLGCLTRSFLYVQVWHHCYVEEVTGSGLTSSWVFSLVSWTDCIITQP